MASGIVDKDGFFCGRLDFIRRGDEEDKVRMALQMKITDGNKTGRKLVGGRCNGERGVEKRKAQKVRGGKVNFGMG